jgi:hypothetical protein
MFTSADVRMFECPAAPGSRGKDRKRERGLAIDDRVRKGADVACGDSPTRACQRAKHGFDEPSVASAYYRLAIAGCPPAKPMRGAILDF